MSSHQTSNQTSAVPSTGDNQVFVDPATEGGDRPDYNPPRMRKEMTLEQELDMLASDLPNVAAMLRSLKKYLA